MQKQIHANKALIMHGKSRQPNAKTMQSKEIKQSNDKKKKTTPVVRLSWSQKDLFIIFVNSNGSIKFKILMFFFSKRITKEFCFDEF